MRGSTRIAFLWVLAGGCGPTAPEPAPPEPESVSEAAIHSEPPPPPAAVSVSDLTDHLDRITAQGLDLPVWTDCKRLIAEGLDLPVLDRPPFGITSGDITFQAGFGHPLPRSRRSEFLEQPRLSEMVDLLVRTHRALEARGIELLLAPIPRPTQIYPERLVEGLDVPADFVGLDGGVALTLRALREAGLNVVHMTPRFAAERELDVDGSNRYLFHDWNNHWTPRGAELGARLVADAVRDLDNFEPGRFYEDRDYFVRMRDTTMAVPVTGRKPIPTPLRVRAVLDDAGEQVLRREHRSSPILLLGDSFCGWYLKEFAAFPDQLCSMLRQPIDLLAIQGPRAEVVWEALIRREGEGRLESKKIVIWLFDSRKFAQRDPLLPFDRLFE